MLPLERRVGVEGFFPARFHEEQVTGVHEAARVPGLGLEVCDHIPAFLCHLCRDRVRVVHPQDGHRPSRRPGGERVSLKKQRTGCAHLRQVVQRGAAHNAATDHDNVVGVRHSRFPK